MDVQTQQTGYTDVCVNDAVSRYLVVAILGNQDQLLSHIFSYSKRY